MGNHTQNFPKVVGGQDAQDMHGLQPEPHRLIEMRNIVKRAIVTFMVTCVCLVVFLYGKEPMVPLWFMMPFVLMAAISVTWFVIAEERKHLQQQAQIIQQQQNQHDE